MNITTYDWEFCISLSSAAQSWFISLRQNFPISFSSSHISQAGRVARSLAEMKHHTFPALTHLPILIILPKYFTPSPPPETVRAAMALCPCGPFRYTGRPLGGIIAATRGLCGVPTRIGGVRALFTPAGARTRETSVCVIQWDCAASAIVLCGVPIRKRKCLILSLP